MGNYPMQVNSSASILGSTAEPVSNSTKASESSPERSFFSEMDQICNPEEKQEAPSEESAGQVSTTPTNPFLPLFPAIPLFQGNSENQRTSTVSPGAAGPPSDIQASGPPIRSGSETKEDLGIVNNDIDAFLNPLSTQSSIPTFVCSGTPTGITVSASEEPQATAAASNLSGKTVSEKLVPTVPESVHKGKVNAAADRSGENMHSMSDAKPTPPVPIAPRVAGPETTDDLQSQAFPGEEAGQTLSSPGRIKSQDGLPVSNLMEAGPQTDAESIPQGITQPGAETEITSRAQMRAISQMLEGDRNSKSESLSRDVDRTTQKSQGDDQAQSDAAEGKFKADSISGRAGAQIPDSKVSAGMKSHQNGLSGSEPQSVNKGQEQSIRIPEALNKGEDPLQKAEPIRNQPSPSNPGNLDLKIETGAESGKSGLTMGPSRQDESELLAVAGKQGDRAEIRPASAVQENPANTDSNTGRENTSKDQPNGPSLSFQNRPGDSHADSIKARTPGVERPQEVSAQYISGSIRPADSVNPGGTPRSDIASSRPGDFLAQLADQIQVQIREGKGEIRIQLKPDSLGHLEIRAESTANGVVARIVAESGNVKNYLETNLPLLQQSLQDQGLKIDRIQVSIQDSSGSPASSGFAAHSGQHTGSGNQGREAGRFSESPAAMTDQPGDLSVDPDTWIASHPNTRFHTIA